MTRQYSIVMVALLTSLSVGAVAAQSRPGRPVIDTLDHHVVRVMNNGPTAWTDTNGWKLVYERTVQPADGSPGMLGSPSRVLLLRDGRLIVTDDKATTINLYRADGTWLRALGRKGEGPGEYHTIEPALLGDTLFIQDYQLARGTLMTLDGKVVRTFPTVCCFGYPASADRHGHLHITGPGANRRGQLLTLSATGVRLDSMPVPRMEVTRQWTTHSVDAFGTHTATFPVFLAPQDWDIVLHNGAVLYGATDSLKFVVTAHGTDTARWFEGPAVPPLEIPGHVRDSLWHLYTDHNAALRAVASMSDLPSTYPVWGDITEDGAGSIWVIMGAGVSHRFAVYAADGRFLGWVSSPPIRSLDRTAWTSDHMAMIDTDDNDLPRVRIFRIERRGH